MSSSGVVSFAFPRPWRQEPGSRSIPITGARDSESTSPLTILKLLTRRGRAQRHFCAPMNGWKRFAQKIRTNITRRTHLSPLQTLPIFEQSLCGLDLSLKPKFGDTYRIAMADGGQRVPCEPFRKRRQSPSRVRQGFREK